MSPHLSNAYSTDYLVVVKINSGSFYLHIKSPQPAVFIRESPQAGPALRTISKKTKEEGKKLMMEAFGGSAQQFEEGGVAVKDVISMQP